MAIRDWKYTNGEINTLMIRMKKMLHILKRLKLDFKGNIMLVYKDIYNEFKVRTVVDIGLWNLNFRD